VPTGVKIFNWIGTLWGGSLQMKTPLYFALGMIAMFIIGGLSGVMHSSPPADLQQTDTYFVVAHFHYVLIGGAVFPLLGAITYWYPKMTGRMMSETWGRISFWLGFLGFQLAFMPMHFLGILGMPRRVYTYPAGLGWETLNMLATIGAFAFALALAIFIVNALASLRRGAAAGPNPWDAPGLEWATASPPPAYNFAHTPEVDGHTPLWDHPESLPVAYGLRVEERELLLTTVVDARPDLRDPSAEPSIWPFVSSLATTAMFVSSIFTPWAVVIGAVPVAAALIGWFWPKDNKVSPEPVID
jgi:cytochrome c oxidase subunit 1